MKYINYNNNNGEQIMLYKDIDWLNLNQYQSVPCLPEEVWVDCDDLAIHGSSEVSWEISNYGRARKVDGNSVHIYKITDNGNGYKKVAQSAKKKTFNYYLHRLVAQAFIPNPDNLPQVNHTRTGLGKSDNRSEHLEWCTGQHNIRDAHANGQMTKRTREVKTLDIKSDLFVAEMYRRYKETGKVGETAREFGVSRTTLSSIVNKRSRVAITDLIDKDYE